MNVFNPKHMYCLISKVATTFVVIALLFATLEIAPACARTVSSENLSPVLRFKPIDADDTLMAMQIKYVFIAGISSDEEATRLDPMSEREDRDNLSMGIPIEHLSGHDLIFQFSRALSDPLGTGQRLVPYVWKKGNEILEEYWCAFSEKDGNRFAYDISFFAEDTEKQKDLIDGIKDTANAGRYTIYTKRLGSTQANNSRSKVVHAISRGRDKTITSREWLDENTPDEIAVPFIYMFLDFISKDLSSDFRYLLEGGKLAIITETDDAYRLNEAYVGGDYIFLPNDVAIDSIIKAIFAKAGFTDEECEKFYDMFKFFYNDLVLGRINSYKTFQDSVVQVEGDDMLLKEAETSRFVNYTQPIQALHGVLPRDVYILEIDGTRKPLGKILDILPDGIHILDTDGRILYVNEKGLELLERSRDDVVGKYIFDFIVPRQREGAKKRLKEKLNGVSASVKTEDRFYLKPDGSEFIGSTCDRVLYKNGVAWGVITTLRVLSKEESIVYRKALEGQVVKTERERQKAQHLAELGVVAAGLVHDLRNPLTAAAAGIMMTLKNATGEDANILRDVQEHLKNADLTVNEFLEYARPEETELSDRIDLGSILNQAISDTHDEIVKYDVAVNSDIAESVKVLGNKGRNRLLRVFVNLITNACHSMKGRDESRLRIVLFVEDENAIVTITDTGEGIRDENKLKIWEPYFSTKAPGEGTGLGMSIIKKVVDAHNGEIEVQSVYGEGTTFKVTIPLAGEELSVSTIKKDLPSVSAARTAIREIKKVLVVDDDLLMRQAWDVFSPEELGAEVITAKNVSAAINILKTQEIDAIITDIQMGELKTEGFELAVRARVECGFTGPIAMCTGMESFKDGATALTGIINNNIANMRMPKGEDMFDTEGEGLRKRIDVLRYVDVVPPGKRALFRYMEKWKHDPKTALPSKKIDPAQRKFRGLVRHDLDNAMTPLLGGNNIFKPDLRGNESDAILKKFKENIGNLELLRQELIDINNIISNLQSEDIVESDATIILMEMKELLIKIDSQIEVLEEDAYFDKYPVPKKLIKNGRAALSGVIDEIMRDFYEKYKEVQDENGKTDPGDSDNVSFDAEGEGNWILKSIDRAFTAIAFFDEKGALTYANKSCVEMSGVPEASELKGINLFDDPNLSGTMRARLQSGISVRPTVYDFDLAKGTGILGDQRSGAIDVEGYIVPVAHKNADCGGYMMFIQDKQRILEQEGVLLDGERSLNVMELTKDGSERFRTMSPKKRAIALQMVSMESLDGVRRKARMLIYGPDAQNERKRVKSLGFEGDVYTAKTEAELKVQWVKGPFDIVINLKADEKFESILQRIFGEIKGCGNIIEGFKNRTDLQVDIFKACA